MRQIVYFKIFNIQLYNVSCASRCVLIKIAWLFPQSSKRIVLESATRMANAIILDSAIAKLALLLLIAIILGLAAVLMEVLLQILMVTLSFCFNV